MNNNTSFQIRLTPIITTIGFAATLCVIAMFLVFVFNKIGQDPLQYIHSSLEYSKILTTEPQILKMVIGVDNIFIICYTTLFLATGAVLLKNHGSNLLLSIAVSMMLVTGLLDVFENTHFLTMIGAAAKGLGISQAQIEMQVWESMVKFHLSYVGLFLFGLCLPRETKLEKTLFFSLVFLQAPVGVLIYVAPEVLSVPLVMVRFVFFMFSLFATSLVFRARKFD